MNPVVHFSEHVLAVPNLAAAVEWWRNVMGFKMTFETHGWAFMRSGDCRLRLGECPDAPAMTGLGDHQYFAVLHMGDVDGLHARLSRAGAAILKAPADEPWGLREMAVQTPDGHRFMVVQPI
jgi:catechol 2,3-dioxygenase-like lactoylglutathione lyase family enzyme